MLSSVVLIAMGTLLLVFLDLPHKFMEGLVNVVTQLSRGLKEGAVKRLGQHFTVTIGDLPLHICLVTLEREGGREGVAVTSYHQVTLIHTSHCPILAQAMAHTPNFHSAHDNVTTRNSADHIISKKGRNHGEQSACSCHKYIYQTPKIAR